MTDIEILEALLERQTAELSELDAAAPQTWWGKPFPNHSVAAKHLRAQRAATVKYLKELKA